MIEMDFRVYISTVALCFVLAALQVGQVSGITCYQCNSTLDHNCQEKFDLDNQYNPNRPQFCNVFDADYCIKITGLWGVITEESDIIFEKALIDDDVRFWFYQCRILVYSGYATTYFDSYCIVGAHRFCSSRHLGDQCQDIWYPDHDRMYRACVWTCSGDNCNSATNIKTSPATLLSILIASGCALYLLLS